MQTSTTLDRALARLTSLRDTLERDQRTNPDPKSFIAVTMADEFNVIVESVWESLGANEWQSYLMHADYIVPKSKSRVGSGLVDGVGREALLRRVRALLETLQHHG